MSSGQILMEIFGNGQTKTVKRFFVLIPLLIWAVLTNAQIKPPTFPVDETPTDTDAFYTQEGNVARKIYLSTLKKFYGIRVNESQLLYTPTTNNNTANTNQIVIGADDNIYLIDVDGDALRLNANEMKVDGGLFIPDTLLLYGANPNMDSIKIKVPRTVINGDVGTASLGIGKTFDFGGTRDLIEVTVTGENGNVTVSTNIDFSNLDVSDTEKIATRLMEDSTSKQIMKDSILIGVIDSLQLLLDHSIDSVKFVNDSISVFYHKKPIGRIRIGNGLLVVDTLTVVNNNFIDVAFDLPISNIENELEVIRDGFSCSHGRDYVIGLDGNGLRRRITFIIDLLNEFVRITLRV